MAGTVTIACRLPNGLYLDVGRRPDGGPAQRVRVNGFAREVGIDLPRTYARTPDGLPVAPPEPGTVVAGYALTPGVDEDIWLAWLVEHEAMEIVKRGLIFAMPKHNDAAAKAKELAENKSGLEPIDPHKPGHGVALATTT